MGEGAASGSMGVRGIGRLDDSPVRGELPSMRGAVDASRTCRPKERRRVQTTISTADRIAMTKRRVATCLAVWLSLKFNTVMAE